MTITNLIIDSRAMLAGAKLIKVTPCFSYENGVRSDKITGYRYTVVLPAVSFEKLDIRIDGKKLMETPEEPITVTFEKPNIRIYFWNKSFSVAASAANIRLA